jgi:hypothetical protein
MTIEFTHKIDKSFFEKITNETVDIYVEPAMDRDLDSDFKMSQVNLTWWPLDFDGYVLEIKLNFMQPL